jgi:hypothetical protein
MRRIMVCRALGAAFAITGTCLRARCEGGVGVDCILMGDDTSPSPYLRAHIRPVDVTDPQIRADA